MHAAARTDLRKAIESVSVEQNQRRNAEKMLDVLKTEFAEKERVSVDEIEAAKASFQELDSLLKQTRAQNEALHQQLATLADQVEQSQAASSEAAFVADGSSSDKPETEVLQSTIAELREVVKYMRSERDIIQAQFDAARRTAERERAATVVLKRSLEEARVEMKALQELQVVGGQEKPIEGLTEKLKNAEMQITLLHESNQLLREETAKLEKALKSSHSELDEIKGKLEPSEKYQRELEVQKVGLEAEKDSLKRDLEAWKGRLQSMVSKFNTVSDRTTRVIIII